MSQHYKSRDIIEKKLTFDSLNSTNKATKIALRFQHQNPFNSNLSFLITLTFDLNISILEIKQQLEALVNIDTCQQMLLCRGKILTEDRNLESYDLSEDNIVYVLKRVIICSCHPKTSVLTKPAITE
jgi:hypothetical protein